MIINKITLIFITIIILTLVSLCYNKVSKKKDNKNLLLMTIMIFIFILFQLCGKRKVEHFNNDLPGVATIRQINLNKSKGLNYDNMPYSNKNEIKMLDINSDTLDFDTGLFGTSSELRDIEVSNNTDIVFDKVKDSNIANLLSSDYKENSEFIEGSLERDYDFRIEDVNYLANINETETSITPTQSKKSKKINSLPINYPDKDKDIIVNSINNDLYNSFFNIFEDTSIVPGSTTKSTKTDTGSKSEPTVDEEKDVGTASTKTSGTAGTKAISGTSSLLYDSIYTIDELKKLTKENEDDTDDTGDTDDTDDTGSSILIDDINNVLIKIYRFTEKFTIRVFKLIRDFIVNLINLLFGTNISVNGSDAENGTSSEADDTTDTSDTTDTDPLVEDLDNIFVRILNFIQKFIIKIYELIEDFIVSLFNFLFGNISFGNGTSATE